jgi:hypothetical protein
MRSLSDRFNAQGSRFKVQSVKLKAENSRFNGKKCGM